MHGHIRCANGRCDKARHGPLCPHCGSYKCVITLYWRGKHYRFRRYRSDGKALDYDRAYRQLTAIRTEIDGGRFNPLDWTTAKLAEARFETLMGLWLAQKEREMRGGELAPSTYHRYCLYNKNHFRSFFDNRDIRDVDFSLLRQFKDGIQGRKLKTKRNLLMALHGFMVWVRQEKPDILKSLPEFPTVAGDDAEIRTALTIEDQAEQFAMIPERDRDPFLFEAETGLRPGEACALKVKDLDLSTGTATIQRTYSDSTIQETTKARRKEPIPLSDAAIVIAQRNAKGKFPESFLFINPRTGGGYRPEILRRLWRRYTTCDVTHYEAGRHSFCTQIIEAGAHPMDAQRLMRHSDRRSTEAYYHAGVERLRNLTNRRGVVPICGTTVERNSGTQ